MYLILITKINISGCLAVVSSSPSVGSKLPKDAPPAFCFLSNVARDNPKQPTNQPTIKSAASKQPPMNHCQALQRRPMNHPGLSHAALVPWVAVPVHAASPNSAMPAVVRESSARREATNAASSALTRRDYGLCKETAASSSAALPYFCSRTSGGHC